MTHVQADAPSSSAPSTPAPSTPAPFQPAPSRPRPATSYDTPHPTSLALALHHVLLAIPPGSEEACREFYVDCLGMREIEKPDGLRQRGGLWLRGDALEIHLGVEEGFTPSQKAHPGIHVHDVDALATHLQACNRDCEWDENLPGHRRFYVRDPAGNRLEFLSALAE